MKKFILVLYSDHAIEDILEKVAVQFHSKYIRGRPLGPAWYPGWPLYVCDQHYNPSERAFMRIKNWLPLIPEEVRSASFMSVQQFDPEGQRLAHPRRMKSPFLKGVKGPGHIGEEGTPTAKTFADLSSTVENVTTAETHGGTSGSAFTSAAALATEQPRMKRHYTKRGTGEIAMRKAREAAEAKAAADAARPAAPLPLPFQQVRAAYQPPRPQVHHHKRKIDDRSVNAAAGGAAYLRDAKIDVLPNETGELSVQSRFFFAHSFLFSFAD